MNQPKERPILFSAHMVRAILAGQKTVTRRVVKGDQVPHLSKAGGEWPWIAVGQHHRRYGFIISASTEQECADQLGAFGACPYGRRGERLWVRETFNTSNECRPPIDEPFIYAADLNSDGVQKWAARWKPSIHMPRAASRILLEITRVRVERLQAISDEQCVAEGCGVGPGAIGVKLTVPPGASMPQAMFAELWKSINGASAWDSNPWVWVVEFKRVTP